MRKGKVKKAEVKRISEIPVINPHCAGIDVSDSEMMVAYPIDSAQLVVQSFGSFTEDLRHLAQCLKSHGITSVAMESTGVYWVPLFLLLQDEGFEVYLVNAKHVKNVTGRKDDESDAEWIQKLHRCGLLSASFQPDNMTRTLRDLVRHRKNLVQTQSSYLNRMQKALELMNIKLHTVISDIDGKTGRRIIEAIIAGERSPEVLADLRDKRIKASRETIIKSLEGCWTKEHLFTLKQCYQLFLTHKEMIAECDREIEQQLLEQIASLNGGEIPELPNIKSKASGKSKLPFPVVSYLKILQGVDITQIDGISEITALNLFSETGPDMSKWPTRRRFTSWCNLVPNTKVSGGKVISSKVKKKKHHAGQAFRMAASSLYHNKGLLGDFYRRIQAKAGPAKATVATANKLATIYYEMRTNQQDFNPQAMKEYQRKHRDKKIQQLKKKLALLEAA